MGIREDAREGKPFLFAVPLFGKAESLMLLNLGVSNRTERGAIRPYSGLNTIGENLRKKVRKNA